MTTGTLQRSHQKNPGNDPGKAACTESECCQHIALKDRSLLSPIQAGGLAAVFKVLANDTRLRLLHALVRADEMCVSDLANSLGMKPQAISNQLQRLSDLGILRSRRQGNSIYYQLVDLCVRSLLDQGLCLMEEVTSRESNQRLVHLSCKENGSC
jgi:DNA-binding transcriptional ArsR family regulator